MSVRESHAGIGKGVQVRSFNVRFWIVGGDVPVSHVVREDEHDMRLVSGDEGERRENKGAEERESAEHPFTLGICDSLGK